MGDKVNKFGVRFTFHSVGQGLFYSGRIGNANFIYDCGSIGSKSDVEVSVKEYANNLTQYNMQIDCAFISHLDADHVNGFEELLKKNYNVKIKRVVIPYFNPIERAYLLLSSGQNYDEGDWYFKFTKDPIRYFTNNENVGEVIVVGRSGGSEEPKPQGLESNYDPEDPDPFKDFKRLTETGNEELRQQVLSGELESNNYMGKDKYISHDSYVAVYGLWIFRLFNYEVDSSLLKQFTKCINRALKGKNLFKIISSKSGSKQLKKCYKASICKGKKKGGVGSINNSSMVLFHGPINNKLVYFSCNQNCLKGLCYHPFFFWSIQGERHKGFGHFLTGDIDLKFDYSELTKHFSAYLGQVTSTLIPHHGSKGNWNSQLFNDIPNCFCWIVSSRTNRSKHPSPDIVLDIIRNKRHFCWSNEANAVIISGEVGW